MPSLFARQSTGGNWDIITDETPEDLTFPADVLADILDTANEVSVWKIAEASSTKLLEAQPLGPELELLAAALHSEHAGDLSEVTLRIISDWKIRQLGLTVKSTMGTSVDAKLNQAGRHSIIVINTVGDAIRLAKAFKKRDPHFFSKDQVLRLFAASVQQGRISTERITSGLWRKLLDRGHLQVVAQQKAPATGTSEARAETARQ